MNTESSEIEEIVGMGSFHKGMNAERKARRLILYGLAFGVGIVTGFLVTNKREVK